MIRVQSTQLLKCELACKVYGASHGHKAVSGHSIHSHCPISVAVHYRRAPKPKNLRRLCNIRSMLVRLWLGEYMLTYWALRFFPQHLWCQMIQASWKRLSWPGCNLSQILTLVHRIMVASACRLCAPGMAAQCCCCGNALTVVDCPTLLLTGVQMLLAIEIVEVIYPIC
jgi:hypothetical protein